MRDWAQKVKESPYGINMHKFGPLRNDPADDFGRDPSNRMLSSAELVRMRKGFDNFREAMGFEHDFLVGCHWEFDLRSSIELARMLEELKPRFLEDPLPVAYSESWKRLAQMSPVPICTGENWMRRAEALPFIVNAALEVEHIDGTSNDAIVDAEALAATAIVLRGTSDRLAVLGQTDAGGDYFEVELTTGVASTFALTSSTGGLVLELFDATGTLIAQGIDNSQNIDASIRDFIPTATGPYYARITGAADVDYALVVVRDATFSIAPNFSVADAQPIDVTGRVLGHLVGTGVGTAERFSSQVAAGDNLTITTFTPGDGAGEPRNALNPRLQLFDEQGTLVATDENAAPDGHNAVISHTAATSGTYQIVIISEAGSGDYLLEVGGVSAPTNPPPSVLSDSVDGRSFGTPPPTIELTMSEAIRAGSVDATDLTIDGGATVTDAELLDGNKVRFTVVVPAVDHVPSSTRVIVVAVSDRIS
ncbi:MAG: pre-peptidase C-terminal domain-containing protein [Acidobacteria bacterium]|nr:pre-peptidase C-terminal domain-containing protein [Acidobacteriota bacterium]